MRFLNVAIEIPNDLSPSGLTSLQGEITSLLLHSNVKGVVEFRAQDGSLLSLPDPQEYPKWVERNGERSIVANREEEDEYLRPTPPDQVMQPADMPDQKPGTLPAPVVDNRGQVVDKLTPGYPKTTNPNPDGPQQSVKQSINDPAPFVKP